MTQLEFGVWDGFAAHEMALSPVAAGVYEQHLREAQLAEELGYHYYSPLSTISFCANHRFGPMPVEPRSNRGSL